eukprot:m.25438 g.25438  ORF g.25438 m.25438 type:complete len:67 (-) comp8714_c0_seq1:1792-1992(-)
MLAVEACRMPMLVMQTNLATARFGWVDGFMTSHTLVCDVFLVAIHAKRTESKPTVYFKKEIAYTYQ